MDMYTEVKKRSKSGQAALEFLMTYGWAILVVLAAIAALAYFGVLSPSEFLPEKCLFETGFTCISSKVEPSQTTVVLSNGIGRTITIDQVVVGGCSQTFTNLSMLSGDEETLVLTGCSNGVSRDVFSADVEIHYTETRTNLTKTAYGQISTKVE